MEHEGTKLFIESAKTFVQLSTGALVFSITFYREVLGGGNYEPLKWSWISLLLSIVSGALYQYVAVKSILGELHGVFHWTPEVLFVSMLLWFHAGVGLFCVVALRRLKRPGV